MAKTKSAEESQNPEKGKIVCRVVPTDQVAIKRGFNIRVPENRDPSPELAISVRETAGTIYPIQVRRRDDGESGYWIIDGERRFRAAQKAGIQEILIADHGNITETEALATSMLDELHLPYAPKERAEAYKRLLELGEVSEDDMSKIFGRSTRTIRESIDTYCGKLDGQVREMNIPVRVAAGLAKVPAESQKEVAERIKGKSREEALREIRAAREAKGDKPKGRKPSTSLYPFVKNPKVLCQDFEKRVNEEIKYAPNNRTFLAYKKTIELFKGAVQLDDLFDRAR